MYSYAGIRQKKIIFTTISFVLANVIEAAQPLVFAYFLNFIQKNGITKENFLSIFFMLLIFLAAELLFWTFHSPARIIENETAFTVKKNYKEYLLRGTMALPLSWHADHHSGDTIDKIEKGSNAIFSFSENTFQFLSAFVRFVISFGALIYFNLYTSFVVIFITLLTFYIIFEQ